jgi:two-component system sensor histidine kinase/response regulator
LRTPLNAIIGFSTVMLDELDGPISALQREDLKTINRNGRFLLHLINELLDLARIEAGRLDLDMRPIDLRALIGEVAETVQGLLHHKPVLLDVKLPERLPRVRGDSAKIRQVLLNLLSNAVKFTDRGSIVVMAQPVVMSGEQARGAYGEELPYIMRNGQRITPYVAVSVRDTGIGIPPESLPLIFEEFRQVHQSQPGKRGSGLGLTICRRLIEAHGGRIWVESMPGQGSVFTFTIPLSIERRADAGSSAQAPGELAAPEVFPSEAELVGAENDERASVS